MMSEDYDWSADIAKLPMPVLLVFADNDAVSQKHIAEFFALLVGGVKEPGWLNTQLSHDAIWFQLAGACGRRDCATGTAARPTRKVSPRWPRLPQTSFGPARVFRSRGTLAGEDPPLHRFPTTRTIP